MKVVGLIFWFFCIFSLAQPGWGQEEDPATDFSKLLENHKYAISFDEKGLSGPGAVWLKDKIAENHFFIFGEQHATKEIAQAGISLFKMAEENGYNHVAVEMGRFEAAFLEDLIRTKGSEGYRAYLAEGLNLLSVPFFSFQEEAPLLEEVVKADGKGHSIWGLDQEFIAASKVVLNILNGLSNTDEEKEAVKNLLDQADQVPFLFGAAPAETFSELKTAFENSTNHEAKTLVNEIILTNRIYAPFTGRGGSVYLANDEREQFMKMNFMRYVKTHQKEFGEIPKVFMKFGANHGSRGRAPTNVYALGNFVMEYGNMTELGTFNLHADCLGGEQLNLQTGGPVPCESYFLSENSPFRKQAFADGLTLYDLQSLRTESKFLKTLDEKSLALVYAYDALLIIRDTTPATLFPGTLPEF